MLQYVMAGLALGSIYAIAASALVVTFVSTGVLNFAFGSMAYVVARFFYWLNSQHHFSTVTAALLSLLVLAPVMGVILYAALFRFIRGRSTLVKIVATIGLSVALPSVANLIFGTASIDAPPGLASLGDKPFHLFGATVTTDQVIIYGFVTLVVVAGTAVLRFTDIGLRVRAMVDSEAMASLSGTSPGRLSVGVWAVSATLTGLAGILVAPTNGLSPTGMTTLMSAAFAAVVVARLRSLSGAVVAALSMGVVTDVIQKYLPHDSSFTAAVVPSIPFAFILLGLVLHTIRSGSIDEPAGVEGPIDGAVRPSNHETADAGASVALGTRWEKGLSLLPMVAVALLPLIFRGSGYWLGLTAIGVCYAVTFLNFTLVSGEGGMLWLSQIIFAGTGALAAAQFATVEGLPVLLAILLGGLIAAAAGAIIGALTIRLGDLYVALATLSLGLLVETLVFTRERFQKGGLGVILNRPQFAKGELAFAYFAFAVFLVLALAILNVRRSTTGLALRSVRASAAASRTLGLSVLRVKLLISAMGAFTAAVGGAFLAMEAEAAQPASFATYAGLVWLAVVVTMGLRSITAAALSGLAFALLPGVMQTYAPSARWGEVPALLFGLGAIFIVRHPAGVVLTQGVKVRRLLPHTARPQAAAIAVAKMPAARRNSNRVVLTRNADVLLDGELHGPALEKKP